MSVITDKEEIKRIREFVNNPDEQGYCRVWHEGLKNIFDTIEAYQKAFEDIRVAVKQLSNANPSYWNSCDVVDRELVLELIDEHDPSKAGEDRE